MIKNRRGVNMGNSVKMDQVEETLKKNKERNETAYDTVAIITAELDELKKEKAKIDQKIKAKEDRLKKLEKAETEAPETLDTLEGITAKLAELKEAGKGSQDNEVRRLKAKLKTLEAE